MTSSIFAVEAQSEAQSKVLWKIFEQVNFSINRKFRKSLNFSDLKADKKNKVFPKSQRTYMAQNFIPKTSTILCSITKRISEIYQLEKE